MAIKRIKDMDISVSTLIKEISWSHLRQANRATLMSFQLTLNDCDDVLICREVVRIIPGKRLVAFGKWQGRDVVAKLFYGRNAARHAKREYDGINALLLGGVLTPALHFHGISKDKRVHVLIFEKIVGAKSLDALWQGRTSAKELQSLMNAMIVELATQHVLGILQHDLHFKNFLVRKKHIYTIDGGDLEIFDKPLSKRDSLDNLGLFFSQLGVGTDDLQKNLFQAYARSRGWLVKKYDLAYLRAALSRWTAKRWADYREKIMRTCSAFVCRTSARSLSVYDRQYESAYFLQLLQNPESFLSLPETKILKKGNTASVFKIKVDSSPLIVKRYNIKNSMHWLRRSLRPTRAAKSWCAAHQLHLMGVATAKPIAFIEKRFLGLRASSYGIIEYIDGIDAGTFFRSYTTTPIELEFVAQKIVNLFEGLAKLELTHGDLKRTNIIISKMKPVLIDLDGMTSYRSQRMFQRAFKQEMKRFLENWRTQPTIHTLFQNLITQMYQRLNMNT